MCMLLITYRVPGLGFIPATRNETHIKQTFMALQPWRHLRFVGKALDRTAEQLRKAHIDMDDMEGVKGTSADMAS